MKNIVLFILILFICTSVRAQTINVYSEPSELSVFEKYWFVQKRDTLLPYRLLPPISLKEGELYPLFIFLHGSGERGKDNVLQLKNGGKFFADKKNRENYPAFVVFPQCPLDNSWANYKRNASGKFFLPSDTSMSKPLFLAEELIYSLLNKFPIDKKRIYISGLSMGGFGTFDIICRRPQLFAAAAPICGGADINKLSKVTHLPMWIFHGKKDDIVPVDLSKKAFKTLKTLAPLSSNVIYTEYPKEKHDSWNRVFEEPDYLKWFFKQSNENIYNGTLFRTK